MNTVCVILGGWFCAASVLAGSVAAKAADALRLVESVHFAWAEEGQDDVIELRLPERWNDPGEFRLVTMRFGKTRTECQINLDAGVGNGMALSANLVRSQRITFVKDDKSRRPLLMLRNWIGGSSPDEVLLYALSDQGGCPVQIWKAELGLAYVQTLQGRTSWYGHAGGEGLDAQTYTYNPMLVYVLTKDKDNTLKVSLDEAAAKAANDAKNYPWAGEAVAKGKVVFFPKPRLIDQKDLARVRAAFDAVPP